ncbi:SDR family oxidoreductase [Phascolarctobacterium sp.]
MLNYSLKGKTYLVVGASSGIGRASAIAISKLGGRVVLSSRNKAKLRETLSYMEGENHIIAPYDMHNILGIKEFIKNCTSSIGGKFDGLVYTSGVGIARLIKVENIKEFDEDFELGYKAYLMLLKEFSSRRILNDGGSIVALSSRAAMFPEKALARYATTKAAVNMTSNIAAQEFAKRKVRVNTICPEMVKTPMAECFFCVMDKEKLDKFYPLGFLEPEDVADLVVFLLSDMSKKFTGQNLYLSAGNAGTPIDGYIV